MQNHAQLSNPGSDSKHLRSKINIVLSILAGLFISGMIGLYLMEVVPRYIVLSIPPPEDSYDLVDWRSTTRSIMTVSTSFANPTSRDFIWRRDATLVYEKTDEIPSWDAVVKYFDGRFFQLGWMQSDTSVPCNLYLPEAAFLQYGENGFVSYRKISDTNEIPKGDTICLAVWNDEGSQNVFRIVLLSVKRSFFTNFYNIFD